MSNEATEITVDDAKKLLSDSIKDFMKAIEDLSFAAKACRAHGIPLHEMHDVILEATPEADRPLIAQQWPMISMMISAL